METLIVRLALQRLSFLRPVEKRRLEAAIAGGVGLERLGFSDLERIVGRLLRAGDWSPGRLLAAARADSVLLARRGIRYLAHDDPEYPPLLSEIHDPPFGLFVLGATLEDGAPSVAIVGTRRATGRGVEAALALARGLAEAGLPVISGLARGIDAAAHRGALAARRSGRSTVAPTVAVLPVGIDAIYPRSHLGLAAAIIAGGGTLVSEYPPGEGPRTWRFPERNRIIAGMARGTIVVEAPRGSGALITSAHALDAGRDVFVAAATLGGAMNEGADALADEGAIALGSAGALLSDWGLGGRDSPLPEPAVTGERRTSGRSLAAALRAELGLEFDFGRDAPSVTDAPDAGHRPGDRS